MRGNLRAHRYRNGGDSSRLDSPLQQSHGLVAHRSARCENDSVRALVAQPFCYDWCRCIAQEATIWNKAHEAKVHGRYSSDDTHVHQIMQAIAGKDAIRVSVRVGRIIIGMIYSDVIPGRVVRNFTKSGITLRIAQVMNWLAFQFD